MTVDIGKAQIGALTFGGFEVHQNNESEFLRSGSIRVEQHGYVWSENTLTRGSTGETNLVRFQPGIDNLRRRGMVLENFPSAEDARVASYAHAINQSMIAQAANSQPAPDAQTDRLQVPAQTFREGALSPATSEGTATSAGGTKRDWRAERNARREAIKNVEAPVARAAMAAGAAPYVVAHRAMEFDGLTNTQAADLAGIESTNLSRHMKKDQLNPCSEQESYNKRKAQSALESIPQKFLIADPS